MLICASLFGSAAIACLAFRFIPAHDPVDVVGVPLITGYSERSEQIFFYVFVASALALGWIGRAYIGRNRLLAADLVGLGPFLLMWLYCANFGMHFAATFVFSSAAAAFWAGARISPTHDATMGAVALSGFALVMLTHGAAFWPFIAALGGPPVIAGALLIALLVLIGFRKRLAAALTSARSAGTAVKAWCHVHRAASLWIALGTILAVSGPDERIIVIGTSLCVLLGASIRDWSQRFVWCTPQALAALAIAMLQGDLISWLPPWSFKPAAASFLSSALYGLALFLFSTTIGLYFNTHVFAFRDLREHRLSVPPWRESWLYPALIVSCALLCFYSFWTGFCLTALVVCILFRRPVSRANPTTGMLIGAALLVTFIPIVDGIRALDPFHDGQVLSAVWEFETGRTLYSEVAILRSFEFFVALIARQLLPPTVDGFHLAFDSLGLLGAGGAAALAYAWTRSAAWSLSTAVLMVYCAQPDLWPGSFTGRDGILLWVAAFSIEFLRSRSWRRWLWPPLLGSLAAAVGFDCFAPLVAALSIGALFMPPAAPAGAITPIQPVGRLLTGAWVALLAVAAPTLIIALWQGVQPAIDYWGLFMDNAANLNASYGAPIPNEDGTWWRLWAGVAVFEAWSVNGMRIMLAAFGLGILASWSVAGVCGWNDMENRKRSFWAFMGLYVFLLFHRGLGRSGVGHMTCVVLPSHVMISLGLFEAVSYFRRRGYRSTLTDRTLIGLSLAACLAWSMPFSFGSPLALRNVVGSLEPQDQFATVPSNEINTSRIAIDEFVLERVDTNQTLWPIETGIANYMYRRHNPTRHAIAFCICSPAEQRIAVRSMQQNPPPIVFFEHYLIDRIPFELRYYVISHYLFRHYRPDERVGYLTPNDGDWSGFVDPPVELNLEFELGRLPIAWGERRSPLLKPSAKIDSELLRWQRASSKATVARDGVAQDLAWECHMQPLKPLNFNYLHLTCACTFDGPVAPVKPQLHLEFGPPGGRFDEWNRMSLAAIPDGRQHTYLIPVGCSPAWSWRQAIDRLRITGPEGVSISKPETELWFIDELEP